jgi:hypothetical protein
MAVAHGWAASLRFAARGREEHQTGQGTSQAQQLLEEIRPSFVARAEPAVAEQARLGPLDHPSASAQSLRGLNATTSDAWRDAAGAQSTAQVRGIVRLVGMALGGMFARPTRFASWADDRGDGIDQRQALGDIMGLGRRQADR